ncbi:MAG: hypothetical protein GY906_22400 [bacterium]|nr:hypothetical protein [bacterium]
MTDDLREALLWIREHVAELPIEHKVAIVDALGGVEGHGGAASAQLFGIDKSVEALLDRATEFGTRAGEAFTAVLRDHQVEFDSSLKVVRKDPL